ncbi:unnamed protein product, partial [Brachionus calyciflorus]
MTLSQALQMKNSSDEDDDDCDDVYQHIEESIEAVIQNINDTDFVDPNLDKTSKSNIIWTRLKVGEATSVRKKISFDQKPGPTSYAARQIDNTKLELVDSIPNNPSTPKTPCQKKKRSLCPLRILQFHQKNQMWIQERNVKYDFAVKIRPMLPVVFVPSQQVGFVLNSRKSKELIIFSLSVILFLLPKITYEQKNDIGKYYGNECFDSSDCFDYLRCRSGICKCPFGYIWMSRNSVCYKCPPRWFEYENNCIYVSQGKRTWFDAKKDCEKKKSNLLTIDTDLVLDFSIPFFNYRQLKDSYHVGATAFSFPKNWAWITGRKIPSSGLMWSECREPSNGGEKGLRLIESCATLSKFGLNDIRCSTKEKYICSFEGFVQRCRYNYQCRNGMKCINSICSCPFNSTYLPEQMKCINLASNVKNLLSIDGHILYASELQLTWKDANEWSKNKSLDLMVLNDTLNLIQLLDHFMKNDISESFWIGGIRINTITYWLNGSLIENGPWFRNFGNCSQEPDNLFITKCVAIENFELVYKNCDSILKFLAFKDNLNETINVNIPTSNQTIISRSVIIRDILVIDSTIQRRKRQSEYVIGGFDFTESSLKLIRIFENLLKNAKVKGEWKQNGNIFAFTITTEETVQLNKNDEVPTFTTIDLGEVSNEIAINKIEIINAIPPTLRTNIIFEVKTIEVIENKEKNSDQIIRKEDTKCKITEFGTKCEKNIVVIDENNKMITEKQIFDQTTSSTSTTSTSTSTSTST